MFRRVVPAVAAVLMCLGISGCSDVVAGTPVAAVPGSDSPPIESEASNEDATVDSAAEAFPEQLADLVNRVRATDVCAMHAPEFAAKWGARQATNIGSGMLGCALVVGDGGDAPVYIFELQLLDSRERSDFGEAESAAGRAVYRDPASSERNLKDTCSYLVPQLEKDNARRNTYATLRARRVGQGGKPTGEWPERCEVSKEYIGAIVDRIVDLAPRRTPMDGRSLLGRYPCFDDAVRTTFPGWTVAPPEVGVYACTYTLSREGEAYNVEVKVHFSLNPDQVAENSRPIEVGGLTGIEVANGVSAPWPDEQPLSCWSSLAYRPAEPAGAWNAHLIGVSVGHDMIFDKVYTDLDFEKQAPPVPLEPCEKLRDMTNKVVAAIG